MSIHRTIKALSDDAYAAATGQLAMHEPSNIVLGLIARLIAADTPEALAGCMTVLYEEVAKGRNPLVLQDLLSRDDLRAVHAVYSAREARFRSLLDRNHVAGSDQPKLDAMSLLRVKRMAGLVALVNASTPRARKRKVSARGGSRSTTP